MSDGSTCVTAFVCDVQAVFFCLFFKKEGGEGFSVEFPVWCQPKVFFVLSSPQLGFKSSFSLPLDQDECAFFVCVCGCGAATT